MDFGNNLLRIKYPEQVTAALMRRHLADLHRILEEVAPGFVLLTDLGDLQSMAVNCTAELSMAMDILAARGVSAVVRIIPDPTKDIGFSILSMFHYPQDVRIITCTSAQEADRYLFD